MKIGVKLVLIISVANIVSIAGLTLSALMFSSSSIKELADQNSQNVT